MPHPFSALSPDAIMSAIESVGIWPAGEPFALNSYENRVVTFLDDDRDRWVVKFYRPNRWSNEAIQEEHDFLTELAQAGVPVVAPWRDEQDASLHTYRQFRFALFPYASGQAPELDDPEHLFALGQVLGQLHEVAARKPFRHRQTLLLNDGVNDAEERILASPWLDEHRVRAYRNVVDKIRQAFDDVPMGIESMIRTHGDCHLGNVLGREASFTLVDFDDCLMAPAIQDIWMLLPMEQPQGWHAQLSEMVEGYEEARPFPHHQMSLIEPLRAYRLIRHSAWLVSRWEDPAFPYAFPWLAEAGYWDQHIRQLEQQLLQLQTPLWLA